jgi:hypothetical protein
MTGAVEIRPGRPLPLLVPTAFVRIRPPGRRRCGVPATQARGRCRAASRRVARQ